jgi:hypothetical protein
MREGEVMDFVTLRDYIGADTGRNLEAMTERLGSPQGEEP